MTPSVDIWLVILLCFGFTVAATFAATGAVVTAAFAWLEYQRGKIEARLNRVVDDWDRRYTELRQAHIQLQKDHDKLTANYMALSEMIRGGNAPEVNITANRDVRVGEFTGRDKSGGE